MRAESALFPVESTSGAPGVTGLDLWRQWFKYWGLISLSVLLVSAVMVLGVLVQPKSYVAEARVWIKTDQQGTPSFLSGVAAYREALAPDPANRKLETEQQLLMARSNVESVVRQLGIRKEQLIDAPISYVERAKPFVWLKLKKDEPTPEQTFNDTVDLFMKAIKVEPARSKTADTTSNVLEVRFESSDPALSAAALNALVRAYQYFGAEVNRKQGEHSFRLIQDKVNQAQRDLEAVDKRILALTIAQGSRADVSSPLNGSQRVMDESGSGLRMDTVLGSARMGADSTVGLMKAQTLGLQARLEEARQLYKDDAEPVRRMQRQLDQVQGRLGRAVKAGAELDAQLKQLDRTRGLAQDRYLELRRKLDQIELYLSSVPDDANNRVATEVARAPIKAESKKKVVLLAIGPLAGLALGLLLAGLRAYFDHRVQSAQDVARYLGLETLGIVPELDGSKA